jgi:hypothetical protein
MKCLRLCALAAIVATMVAGNQAAAQLVNPGFETDAVLNAAPNPVVTGWTLAGNANTTSANSHPVHSGIGSLRLVGNGNFGVPVAFQTLPASPGQTWDFQGYMLTPATLPADATFGLLKIVWSNGINDLAPGPILIGQPGPPANPGVEALPFVNSTSTPNAWQFTQARGVAPAGATQVSFFSIFVDQSAGTAYFDDLRATLIPEPASIALMGLAMFGGAALVRRPRARGL